MIEKGNLRRTGPSGAANRGDEEPRRGAGGPAAALGATLQADIPPANAASSPGGVSGAGLGPLHIFSIL